MTLTTDTTDIDLASAYMVITGKIPPTYFQPGETLGTFELSDTDLTRQLLFEYATGALTLNVKRFCSCRALLFRKLKEARR